MTIGRLNDGMQNKREKRRFWQFSLAALLVCVTVCAAILGLWRPWHRLSIEIEGNIAADDVEQIKTLTAQLTNEPILSIRRYKSGDIEVMTGEVRGPLDGGGRYFIFQKTNGKWTKVSDSFWVSQRRILVPILAFWLP